MFQFDKLKLYSMQFKDRSMNFQYGYGIRMVFQGFQDEKLWTFTKLYWLAKALGMRIYNAIGNHMDYNKGFVTLKKRD